KLNKMKQKILEHFKKVDPIIYKLALKINIPNQALPHSSNYFVELVDTIVSQQLSAKASATIFGRLKDLMPGENITAQNLMKISDEEIRGAGISYSKIKYIKGVAEKILEGTLILENFDKEGDLI